MKKLKIGLLTINHQGWIFSFENKKLNINFLHDERVEINLTKKQIADEIKIAKDNYDKELFEEFVEVLSDGKFYMSTNEFIDELKNTGFEFKNTWISDPKKSECGRFEVEPLAYYF